MKNKALLGWRDVPVNRAMPMSEDVRKSEPVIRQIFIGRGPDILVPDALERKLYVIRKTASAKITSPSSNTALNTMCQACRAAPSSTKVCCWPTK